MLGIVLIYINGTQLIKYKMDELTKLNNKITLTQQEYNLETDATIRQNIALKLSKLRLRKQVLELQNKISKL